jgi:hypothetical protein
MGGECSMYGKMRSTYKIQTGKAEGKRIFGRPRYRWEDHIRMDLCEQGGELWTGFIWLKIRIRCGLLLTR